MPVSFLTEEQERRYGCYAGEPSPEQLARYFHLDDADRAFVAARRGGHMRLGCAVQLGTVRFLGTFLENPADVPPRAVRFVADQVGVAPDGLMAEYAASRWRIRHPAEIRERYGYRPFSDPFVQFRLNRWLYALCWTGTDRPSALFDQATAWLAAGKVLLPGATTLERNVARVRSRAAQRLWRQALSGITPDQRERLESLLVPPEGTRQSPLDRLRNGPVLQSPAELARAIARLDEVRGFAAGLPQTDRLPRTRVLALARFAAAASRCYDPAAAEAVRGRSTYAPEPLNRAFGPGGVLRSFDLRGEIARIAVPTLVLAGRHDWICPPEFSEEIYRLIPGSRLRIFEDSSHSIRADEPDALNAAIREFIAA